MGWGQAITPPGHVRGWGGILMVLPVAPPRKDVAPCCVAKRDALGRLPIGFCGPDCVRRRKRTVDTES